MVKRIVVVLAVCVMVGGLTGSIWAEEKAAEDVVLKKAMSFHASFDASGDASVVTADPLFGAVKGSKVELTAGKVGKGVLAGKRGAHIRYYFPHLFAAKQSTVMLWAKNNGFSMDTAKGFQILHAPGLSIFVDKKALVLEMGGLKTTKDEKDGSFHEVGLSQKAEAKDFKWAANAWNHIAAQYDKDAAKIKLFVNGKEVASQNVDKEAFPPFETFGPESRLAVGPYNPTGEKATLVLDEVKIYKALLTPEQIKEAAGL